MVRYSRRCSLRLRRRPRLLHVCRPRWFCRQLHVCIVGFVPCVSAFVSCTYGCGFYLLANPGGLLDSSGPALSGACLASKHACPVLRDSHFADAADAGAPRVREARTPLAPQKFTFVHVDVFRSGPRRIGGAKWARKSVSGANCVVARAQLLSASQLEHEPVRLPCLAPSGLGGVLTLRRGLLLPRASRS